MNTKRSFLVLGLLLFAGLSALHAVDDTAKPAVGAKAASTSDDPAAMKGPPRLNARHWGLYGGSHSNWMEIDVAVSDLPIFPDGWGYNIFASLASRQSYWDDVHKLRLAGKFLLPILGLKGEFEERVEQLERMFGDHEGCRVYRDDLVGVALGHEVTTKADPMENRLYDHIKSRWPTLQVYKFYSGPIKPYSGLAAGNPERCDGYLYDIYGGDKDGFRRVVQKFVVTGKPVVILIWATEPGWGGYFTGDLVKDSPRQDGMIRLAPNSDLEKYFWHSSDTLRQFGLPVILFGVTGAGGSASSWYAGGDGSPNLSYIRQNLAFRLRDEMRRSRCAEPQPSADYSWGLGVEVVDLNGQTAFDYGVQQSAWRQGMDKSPKRILAGPYVDDFVPDDLYIGLRTIDHATIRGFTHLVHLGQKNNGVLATRDDAGKAGVVDLIYRFHATQGTLSNIKAELTGIVNQDAGAVNSLALSYNGEAWQQATESTPGAAQTETLRVASGNEPQDLSEFYVRVRMAYARATADKPASVIDKLVVHAERKALPSTKDQ